MPIVARFVAMTLFAIALATVGIGILVWRTCVQGSPLTFTLPSFRLIPLPLVGLALQIGALRWSGGIERIVLFALSQALLLTFLVANWRSRSLRLLILGYALNIVPILLNGGYMPITPETMSNLHPGTTPLQWTAGLVRAGSKDIVQAAAQAPFWFLGDVFVVSRPFPLPTAFSVGDILILLGFGWVLLDLSKPRWSRHDQPYRP